MQFPERFQNLPDYAFPRLRKLLDSHAPGAEPVVMTIGEPIGMPGGTNTLKIVHVGDHATPDITG